MCIRDGSKTKEAMIAASRRVVLLTDHSKVGAVQFCKFGDVAQLDTIVTDTGLDEETAEKLSAQGPDAVSYTHLDVYKRQPSC